ncbi:MAG: MopE-related protein [Myxococcota bacterium]|nr:MopE-related protein [Myxococcota bacterium]
MSRWLFVLGGVVLTSCSEQKVSVYNTPPGVEITSPEDGELFDLGEPVRFEGLVVDSQDDANELTISWESSVDGPLDDDPADAAGLVFFDSSILSSGTHTVSLTATDSNGESAAMSVTVSVGGSGVGREDGPSVRLDGPADGLAVLQSEPVTIIGMVTDNEQPWGTLDCTVISSRDGLLWEGRPSEFGVVEVDVAGFSEGTHTITLGAVDRDANQESAQVTIEVVADARPSVLITHPGPDDWYWNTDIIRMVGQVSDDVTFPTDLSVVWASDIDGELSTVPANPVGDTSVETALSAGFHTITLAATDVDGNTTADMTILEVRDPLDHDGDLDGYTENEGDCNDADPYTNPGEEDVCDDRDNDCDGMVNEDDWDELESNDELGTASHLGRIDDGWILEGCETITTSLTLHSEGDEDWFTFDAGDDWGIDNVDLTISVSPMPFTGSFVLELYELGDSHPTDVAMGSGRLTVEHTGDLFDGSEDDWAVRIYADDWPGGSCSRRFTLEIQDC